MDVLHGLADLPDPGAGAAVTIGFFDGVHLGDPAVLERTVEAARERSLRSAAITFDRHPREILTPDSPPRLLPTPARKNELTAATGADHTLLLGCTVAPASPSAARI